jgi:hypothetical protein
VSRAVYWVPFVLATMLFALLACIAIYDAWVLLIREGAPTVSDVVKRVSASYPVLPFLAGFCAGHLWF